MQTWRPGWSVECPTCKAEPGQPCRTRKTNLVTDTHMARLDAEYAEHEKRRQRQFKDPEPEETDEERRNREFEEYLRTRPPHDRNPETPQEGLACEGEHCIYHNPSDHHMNTWRISRGGERVCPHGVGHPDPDYLAWLDRVKPGHVGEVHACDGCCFTPEKRAQHREMLKQVQ